MKFLLFTLLILTACTEEKFVSVDNFTPEGGKENDTIVISADLSEISTKGVVIPAVDKPLQFSFDINNHSGKDQKFYYKIYYQNESYKYDEFYKDIYGKKQYNPLSANNFYGSWEDASEGFRLTETIKNNKTLTITDGIKIMGNPRAENQYFGANPIHKMVEQKKIDSLVNRIKSTEDWYKSISKKAKSNNSSIEDQMYQDALWIIRKNISSSEMVNNRWKRNPRMGNYSFIVVVVPEADIKKIPTYLSQINTTNDEGAYINPFYFFIHNKKKVVGSAKVASSSTIIKATSTYSASKGLYVNPLDVGSQDCYNHWPKQCGATQNTFDQAHFQQYFKGNQNRKNIPVIADVSGDDFTKEVYNTYMNTYSQNKDFVASNQNITCPCSTVYYQESNEALVLENPGNENLPSGKYIKEDVGIKGRFGFTYGKFRAKIRFPQISNSHNMWNGLTNAFWLIYQSEEDWNKRDICKEGYITRDIYEEREPQTTYSEIALEIVKAGVEWPNTSYKDKAEINTSYNPENENIVIATSNWDLACAEPTLFDIGAHYIHYNQKEYTLHRWNNDSKVVTTKTEMSKTNLAGEILYYEIDWQVDKIITRVGSSPDKMQVIAYMDSSVTKIPNNQMVPMVTQQFHNAEWWPTAPYKQQFIPFPLKGLKGEVFEITVE